VRVPKRILEPEPLDRRQAPTPAEPALLALQRGAGNAAVSRLLASRRVVARDDAAPPKAPVPRVSYVFLMGDVKDAFYDAANQYFTHMVKGATVVKDKRTLADVISHVNAQGKPVDTLYIVSHANESGNLGFSLDAADLAKDKSSGDNKPRLEFGELKEANAGGTLPKADAALIDAQTKIEIKGCNIGRSETTLDALDEAFGGQASVTAPTHKQEYRYHSTKQGMVYEENLDTMFIEEPGIADKDKAAVGAAFKAKYTMVDAKAWPGLLAKVSKKDKSQTPFTFTQPNPPDDTEKAVFARMSVATKYPKAAGWVVTYNGRTTVGDEYKYEIQAERVKKDGSTEIKTEFITVKIPPDDTAMIEREKAKHGRPDAYAWSVKRTVAAGSLKLEVRAERTEWIVEGTIKDASGAYHPAESNRDWYKTSTFAPAPAPAP
jgi:hypothetical protein